MASKAYNVLFIVAMLLFSSCSVFRGLTLDGPSGPDIYEYQKLERDTIFKYCCPIKPLHAALLSLNAAEILMISSNFQFQAPLE